MSLYHIIFISVATLLLISTVFIKREVDLFSVVSLSLLYYYFPMFSGKVYITNVTYGYDVNDFAYIIVSLVMLMPLIIINLRPASETHKMERRYATPSVFSSISFAIIALFLVLTLIYTVGLKGLFGISKHELRNQAGSVLSLLEWFTLISLSVGYISKKRYVYIISMVLLLFSLSLGSRSIFVIGIISIFFLKLSGKKIRLISYYKYILYALLFICLVALYKLGYRDIRQGDFIGAINSMLNFDFITLYHLIFVDSNSVVYNLSTVLDFHITLDNNYMYHRLLSFFPGAGDLFSYFTGESYPRFSYILNTNYHTDVHWGLASSIYGEVYSIVGLFGVFIFSSLVYMLLYFYNISLKLTNNVYTFGFLPIAVYISFYIHRVDVTFVFGIMKTFLLLAFVYYILTKLVCFILPSRSSNEF